MDVSRLSETLGQLRYQEGLHKLQAKLLSVRDALESLSSNPGDHGSQVALTSSLDNLYNTISTVVDAYDPAELDRMIEIGAGPYFTHAMPDRIRAMIAANPMSPATALEDVRTLSEQRKVYIDRVVETEKGIDSFVPYSRHLSPGESDIGFELPRSMFDNEFKDFISELRTLQRIMRVFSEVETGSVPEIKLGQISSSDPLIFLHAPPVVILSIAGSISWLLREWKKLEEIRKLRAETAKIGQFESSELEEFFDKKIQEKLDIAIGTQAEKLLDAGKLKGTRRAELDSELSWALRALFARVERGMRIEVRVEELPEKKDGEEANSAERQLIESVQKIAKDLHFPRIEAEPILSLPKSAENETPRPRPRTRPRGEGPPAAP